MTDQEMLELAARAALGKTCIPRQAEDLARRWNPLDEDEAALRLAVRLRMQVLLDTSDVTVTVESADGAQHQIREQFRAEDQGEFIATRRAIVRAAASIGKEMP